MSRIAGETGIIVLDNDVAEFAGIRVVGTTLWSDLDRRLDYLVDGNSDSALSGDDWRQLQMDAKEFLHASLRPGDVLVTHHGPGFDGLKTSMQHDMHLMSLASAYYSDLERLIVDLAPQLVVHGQTHVTRRYEIGNVPVVTNARGHGPAATFRPDFVVAIEAA